ncbi:hypothetical protein AK812_SmicGene19789 [Symbiodinium microadriaticum]|uniref:C2H2-type domain-containing protein n=1 Tax=Symbiodinium microadriaticum TaxID=2951 RepID=A0A1Q9DRR5_SYMMI|nr:hypothetical protein AK812_SmicGene19789 [Symbiodinium microadriaticum]
MCRVSPVDMLDYATHQGILVRNCIWFLEPPPILRWRRILYTLYHAMWPPCVMVQGAPALPLWLREQPLLACLALLNLWGLSGIDRGLASLTWAMLWCYLGAFGFPLQWIKTCEDWWEASAEEVCQLQAALHSCWWDQPLPTSLPPVFHLSYHGAWQQYPIWGSGVPEEILIATDGSGLGAGGAAFAVWAFNCSRWYRIGWFAECLSRLPWSQMPAPPVAGLLSFHSELCALQAAGLWASAIIDHWAMHTGARPQRVTVAVDNAAALQIAAGHANPFDAVARWCRECWQSVQARCSTTFRHVYGHQGVFVNTIVDALAGAAVTGLSSRQGSWPVLSKQADLIGNVGPWLWLLPQATLRPSGPVFAIQTATPCVAADSTMRIEEAPASDSDRHSQQAPLPLHILTANVQSLKDARANPFNPSGHAARRQYLYQQFLDCKVDIACIQEARSRAGRWDTAGILTWRSGSQKGQYSCEVWIRPNVISPALALKDFRVLTSTPRCLVLTCIRQDFPITVCSAHGPHADRPDIEAEQFWRALREALGHISPNKCLVVGVDANADFLAADDHNMLVGSLLGRSEPTRNDTMLLETCLNLGLEAPATFDHLQKGPTWSWEHTSGKRKRLDHLLFRPGPWEHSQCSQAIDFDLANAQRDHMPLRACVSLRAPRPRPSAPKSRPCSAAEVEQHGSQLWSGIRTGRADTENSGSQVRHLLSRFDQWRQSLPKRPPLQVKQPYISPYTLQLLHQLRDHRAHLRYLRRQHEELIVRSVFTAWQRRPLDTNNRVHRRHSALHIAAVARHVEILARHAHTQAKADKVHHFTLLLDRATEAWHAYGKPADAIIHLRWASRRSAERRAVHAAGGYDIDAALEEQFRAQEGAQRVTEEQVQAAAVAWWQSTRPSCPAAMPTLVDAEFAVRRQAGRKASGPDGIPNEVWKLFPAYSGLWFWKLCTGIALVCKEPLEFKRALVCALYKKGPAALPENYRSIALLNGMAKVWHGHVRRTVGQTVLARYEPLQLGGRAGVPVGFAVSAFRSAVDLCRAEGRCYAALFVDIQAAYYEASRDLIFREDPTGTVPQASHLQHLAPLVQSLLASGALELLGVPDDEIALLHDCVAVSHWCLVGSPHIFLATRGSRPGDGLADVLFGALFSIALRHIKAVCRHEGWGNLSAGSHVGRVTEVLQLGWADDLAVLSDYDSAEELRANFPRVATVVLSTLRRLRFRVNLGAGKTEAMLAITGSGAVSVRGELLGGASTLPLPTGDELRLTPEYRYLGVVQTVRDNGRRDNELNAQRAQAAWAHARSMMTSSALPWALKRAWVAGRVLPAAYATLSTCLAVSGRATAPLQGFFERTARVLVGSWQYGHVLTRPALLGLLGLCAPEHAVLIARARLVTQLVAKAPSLVWELFDAAWNRGTEWCQLLADACRQVMAMISPCSSPDSRVPTILAIRHFHKPIAQACRYLSRWGTAQAALTDLWSDVAKPREKLVIGTPGVFRCHMCSASLPSCHALAAHIHRKHSVVNCLTKFTHGTVCLWCHVEMHSTDRLKYHLRTTPRSCLHGLRVTVGESYVYGTGTKRTGRRGHVGLPPTRMVGPRNATPAQRLASLEQRVCSEHELRQELYAAAAVYDVYEWPPAPPAASQADAAEGDPAPPATKDDASGAREGSISPATAAEPIASLLSFFTVVTHSQAIAADRDGLGVVSPLWQGLSQRNIAWRLPRDWHAYWRLWAALQTGQAWDYQHKPAFSCLRRAIGTVSNGPDKPLAGSEQGPPSALLDLVAATVTFRQVISCVQRQGLLWIPGNPSRCGIEFLRKLLPHAVFRLLSLRAGAVFVAAHPRCSADTWLPAISSLGGLQPHHVQSQAIRASLVYRTQAASS